MGHSSRYALSAYHFFVLCLSGFNVVIIIGFTQLLALVLGRIRQPRVIAEVIGGVILGPSIMGRDRKSVV